MKNYTQAIDVLQVKAGETRHTAVRLEFYSPNPDIPDSTTESADERNLRANIEKAYTDLVTALGFEPRLQDVEIKTFTSTG